MESQLGPEAPLLGFWCTPQFTAIKGLGMRVLQMSQTLPALNSAVEPDCCSTPATLLHLRIQPSHRHTLVLSVCRLATHKVPAPGCQLGRCRPIQSMLLSINKESPSLPELPSHPPGAEATLPFMYTKVGPRERSSVQGDASSLTTYQVHGKFSSDQTQLCETSRGARHCVECDVFKAKPTCPLREALNQMHVT